MHSISPDSQMDSSSWAMQESIAILAVDRLRPTAQCLELMLQIDDQKITHEQAVASILQKAEGYAAHATELSKRAHGNY